MQDPPNLLEEFEDKLMELMEVNFDPSSHPNVLELARLLSGEGNGGGVEEAEEDVQVKKVSRCLGVELLLVCVCIRSSSR